MRHLWRQFIFMAVVMTVGGGVVAQDGFINGDAMPAAAVLAARGDFAVGVQTLDAVNPDQIEVRGRTGADGARSDRVMSLEIWYPAAPAEQIAAVEYQDVLPASADAGVIPFSFKGRALPEAEPLRDGAPYPLVVVSHGYPGSRVQLTYLTENLASKGYVVVAIGHTDSTFDNTGAFENTLANRAPDMRFTIDTVESLAAADSGSFLSGLADTENVGLVGFSMGGYGSLNVAGAGYSPLVGIVAGDVAGRLLASSADYAGADARVKAVFTFAPFGADLSLLGVRDSGFWDDAALAEINVPVFFVAGDLDDVAGYENGVRHLFEAATGTERYLLTYANARHNVGGNPPPPEATSTENWFRYGEPAWDVRTLNNTAQHFATAFFGVHLKSDDALAAYLGEGWRGFPDRAAVGMTLERRVAGE